MSEETAPVNNEKNIPPSSGWIDPVKRYTATDEDVSVDDARRWVLGCSGEVVMWGEGMLRINFRKMLSFGHEPGGYELLVGGRVGMVPEVTYRLETPNGRAVGSVIGTVSHKLPSRDNPNIHAMVIDDE